VNIFVLDSNIKKCAEYHCDKHVIKMILESAQLLSTVLRINNINYGYEITHPNHSCTLWAGKSLSNWKWLRELGKALNTEYRFRFNKEKNHKSFDLIQGMPIPKILDCGLTPFVKVMPKIYQQKNPIYAYRKYYIEEKKHILNWTKRSIPFWI